MHNYRALTHVGFYCTVSECQQKTWGQTGRGIVGNVVVSQSPPSTTDHIPNHSANKPIHCQATRRSPRSVKASPQAQSKLGELTCPAAAVHIALNHATILQGNKVNANLNWEDKESPNKHHRPYQFYKCIHGSLSLHFICILHWGVLTWIHSVSLKGGQTTPEANITAPIAVSIQSYRVQFSTQELPAYTQKHGQHFVKKGARKNMLMQRSLVLQWKALLSHFHWRRYRTHFYRSRSKPEGLWTAHTPGAKQMKHSGWVVT